MSFLHLVFFMEYEKETLQRMIKMVLKPLGRRTKQQLRKSGADKNAEVKNRDQQGSQDDYQGGISAGSEKHG